MPGCVVNTALNYDTVAEINDNSCRFEVLGCTDSLASNYLSTATTEKTPSTCTSRAPRDAQIPERLVLSAPLSSRCIVCAADRTRNGRDDHPRRLGQRRLDRRHRHRGQLPITGCGEGRAADDRPALNPSAYEEDPGSLSYLS